MEENLRQLIRQEMAAMRDDIKLIKQLEGQRSVALQAILADIGNLKHSCRDQSRELRKLGVLIEDLDYIFQATAETD